jgi:uncharacterized protein (UPF0548 family)
VSVERRIVTTAPVPSAALAAYERLGALTVNFAPMRWEEAAADPAWRADRRRIDLPSEPPGPPVDGGSFAVARELLWTYEVADPTLVRAVYDAAAPLAGRDMLLVGRFAGLRFPMGVRVGGVIDRPGPEQGDGVARFAWHYRTLEGHLERGQMDYEVSKDAASGRVEFRMAAYSQRGRIDNPVVRAGFTLFGRPTQLRFYARALERMRRFTAERAVLDGR